MSVDLTESMKFLLTLVNERSQPIIRPFNKQFRDMPALRWDVKVIGNLLAQILYQGSLTVTREAATPFVLGWGATKAEDFSKRWFIDACHALKMAPILHRKVWELVYVINTLEAVGKLSPSKRGIGFGCGSESLPSYFASRGAHVLATDRNSHLQRVNGWASSNRRTSGLEKIFKPELISRDNSILKLPFVMWI
jgi:hypothetical protein